MNAHLENHPRTIAIGGTAQVYYGLKRSSGGLVSLGRESEHGIRCYP